MTSSIAGSVVLGCALLLFDGAAAGAQDPTDDSIGAIEAEEAIFLDGFDLWTWEGCEAWSSTSTPTGALDQDGDGYGRISPAIVQCSPSFPPNTDCFDSNSAIHPGATELCNGLNDDCSAVPQDGRDEPWFGVSCDGPFDTDLCEEATYTCKNGSQACDDFSDSTVELCAGDAADEDCDGQVDEGFVIDSDPSCGPGSSLGSISGDTGAEVAQDTNFTETFESLVLSEDNGDVAYLSSQIDLYSPPGVDFDLYVYCLKCGSFVGSSTTHDLLGHHDIVDVRNDDKVDSDDGITVLIEVRYVSSDRCASWVLTATGNQPADTNNCDP